MSLEFFETAHKLISNNFIRRKSNGDLTGFRDIVEVLIGNSVYFKLNFEKL